MELETELNQLKEENERLQEEQVSRRRHSARGVFQALTFLSLAAEIGGAPATDGEGKFRCPLV